MSVFNYTEQLARQMFMSNAVNSLLKCHCEQCCDDVLAMALSNLPARYASTETGRAFVKANYLQIQLQSDVLRELTTAAMVVSNHPHHAHPELCGGA